MQPAMGEDLPGALESVGQNGAGPGQVQQPQGSQRPERGQRDHRQVDKMAGEEPPARRRQVKPDEILDYEHRPHHVVDDLERVGDAGREARH
ncbi:MAG TPA: hypothetical protein VHN16_10035 [Streptosporangiaceae bacterium]|nr:hypothetical protein [Streptosporangiaceae bacterium]